MTDSSVQAATPDAASRRSELLHLIRAQGKLDVAGVDVLLRVSAETLRRDLRSLELQGLIRRGYGIAYPVESGAFESALEVREGINPEEKSRIANAVIPHIGEAQTLFIDEGYQTLLIAQRLPTDRRFTVVTASLPVATLLAVRPNISVVMLGGRVRGSTLGVVDSWAA
jgi:DeoR/GlpR family transcriptional regulator of sugar metabolism